MLPLPKLEDTHWDQPVIKQEAIAGTSAQPATTEGEEPAAPSYLHDDPDAPAQTFTGPDEPEPTGSDEPEDPDDPDQPYDPEIDGPDDPDAPGTGGSGAIFAGLAGLSPEELTDKGVEAYAFYLPGLAHHFSHIDETDLANKAAEGLIPEHLLPIVAKINDNNFKGLLISESQKEIMKSECLPYVKELLAKGGGLTPQQMFWAAIALPTAVLAFNGFKTYKQNEEFMERALGMDSAAPAAAKPAADDATDTAEKTDEKTTKPDAKDGEK